MDIKKKIIYDTKVCLQVITIYGGLVKLGITIGTKTVLLLRMEVANRHHNVLNKTTACTPIWHLALTNVLL